MTQLLEQLQNERDNAEEKYEGVFGSRSRQLMARCASYGAATILAVNIGLEIWADQLNTATTIIDIATGALVMGGAIVDFLLDDAVARDKATFDDTQAAIDVHLNMK